MSDLPRVLFVDHTARLGGGEIALLNLVTTLDRERYEPVVLLFADGPLRQKLQSAGIETHVLPLAAGVADARKDALGGRTLLRAGAFLSTMVFIGRVCRTMVRLRPAVVHTNSLKADVIGGLAARLARLPLVWHVRDRIADDYLPPRVARAFRWLARRVPHVVIANSDSTLDTLFVTNGRSRRPVTRDGSRYRVVHDGTPLPEYEQFLPADPGRALCVGMIGRLAPWKGQHVFIAAARQVHERHPHSRFQIIGSALFGENQYESDIRKAVADFGLTDVVEFTGFRADVSAVLAGIDILVHASITGEPFGQVIIEGMAAGKAVVATRGGGVPEIVIDEETGLLVPMGDAAAMARAINRLLDDSAIRTTMGEHGRRRVAGHFTVQLTAEKVERIFDELLHIADKAAVH